MTGRLAGATRALALLGAATSIAACDEPIARGWRLDRTRVLGARVEAEGDATRASLVPGERARLTWLVAGPSATPRLEWAMAACAAPEGTNPAPRCATGASASTSGAAAGTRIDMDLEVPPAAALGDARELLVLAAFCGTGAPALDPRVFEARCASGAPALLASTRVRLAAAGENRNPPFAPDALTFAGAPWPSPPPGDIGGPCVPSPEAPLAVAGSGELTVEVALDPAAREPAPEERGGFEELLVSHFVSDGELDRQFSFAEAASVEVAWKPPAEVGPDGRLVRFVFVVRDGRGGASFAERAACLRRP